MRSSALLMYFCTSVQVLYLSCAVPIGAKCPIMKEVFFLTTYFSCFYEIKFWKIIKQLSNNVSICKFWEGEHAEDSGLDYRESLL